MKCPICEIRFYCPNQAENIFSTPCGHVYHKDCLLNWVRQHHNCPTCRKTCYEQNIIQLYLSANYEDAGSEGAGNAQVLDVLGTRISDLQIGVNSKIDEIANMFGNFSVSFSTYESKVRILSFSRKLDLIPNFPLNRLKP
jgi:hypothetical protein